MSSQGGIFFRIKVSWLQHSKIVHKSMRKDQLELSYGFMVGERSMDVSSVILHTTCVPNVKTYFSEFLSWHY